MESTACTSIRKCPSCSGEHAEILTGLRFKVFDDCPLEGSFSFVSCLSCGFCYYDTPSRAEAFEAYYRGNAYYFSAATAGSGGCSEGELKRYERTADCISRYIDGKGRNIFDIGCGKGGLILTLKSKGFSNLYAVDALPECVEYIRNNLGIISEVGRAENLPFPDIKPDCLIYSHVLEHVLSPRDVLMEAWNRLEEKGLVYIEVPDASRYGEFSGFPLSELYLEHVNHFDIEHLRVTVESIGFSTVETGDKILEEGTDAAVPCIYGLFRKSEIKAEIKPDLKLASVLKEYFSECEKSRLYGVIKEIALSGKPVYVWGLSQYAQLLLGQTSLGDCCIKAYVDGDVHKQSKTIGGMRIFPPDVLKEALPSDYVVLTGINYRRQMRLYLDSIGFRGTEIRLQEEY
jgi:SAM-dependent methyltransferase